MAALDEVLPVYRHRERHQRTIPAQPADVWQALLAITTDDLPLSRFLMGVHSIPQRLLRGSDGFASRHAQPVVETFKRGGFRELRAEPGHLLIAGAAIQPWRLVGGRIADVRDLAGFRAFDEPGFVLAAISFELETTEQGTRLGTETRVQPTDPRAGRAFLPYWLVIRAGSGLIRREMLRAVARRAGRYSA
jgi:hypothetical protein